MPGRGSGLVSKLASGTWRSIKNLLTVPAWNPQKGFAGNAADSLMAITVLNPAKEAARLGGSAVEGVLRWTANAAESVLRGAANAGWNTLKSIPFIPAPGKR